MKKIYLFNNYKKVMSPEEIFSQFLNCEFMSKILHLMHLFYPIFTSCVALDPDPQSSWLCIQYGSVSTILHNICLLYSPTRFCWSVIFFLIVLLCPVYILIYICILYGCLTDFFPHRKYRYGITLCVFMYQTVAIATSISC